MSERRKTLLICVGVGGVFYHGLTRLTTFVNRRGLDDIDVLLVDPDVVDETNGGRQWATKIGEAKVLRASGVLWGYGIEAMGAEWTWQEHYPMESMQKCLKLYAKVIVIHTPDNHECRVQVHEDCKDICRSHCIPVMEITGGNTAMDGYAYGTLWLYTGGKEEVTPYGDWTKRHPDILDSAEAEIARREDPHACAGMGTEEQTVHSNHLTAHCIWSLAEVMWSQRVVGEYKWMTIPADKWDRSGEVRNPQYDRIWSKVWDVEEGVKKDCTTCKTGLCISHPGYRKWMCYYGLDLSGMVAPDWAKDIPPCPDEMVCKNWGPEEGGAK